MYKQPKTIHPEIFARLPEQYRKRCSGGNRWLQLNLRGADRHSLLEGPSFDLRGNLYVVDVPFGRIFRVSEAGIFTLVTEYDGEPNGLKIHRDGRIFVADHRNGIMLLDPDSGQMSLVCGAYQGQPFKGVNDLIFAENGDLYFTDQGQSGLHDPSGSVFKLDASGVLTRILTGIPSPNGLVLNRDETALYLAVTRDNAIWRLPFLLDGSVSKVGVFIRLSGGTGPDGMALDQEGGLAVAHIGLGSVWIFDSFGEPTHRIVSPEGRSVTNLAYGGIDRRDLYITEAESGCILRARLLIGGKPMFSHA